MQKRKNLIGEKFGKLEVIGQAEDAVFQNGKRRCARWICKCECGNTTTQYATCLKRDSNQSCGCLRIKKMRERCWKGYEEISGSYYNRIIRDAKKRNLEWCIEIEYCWELFVSQERKCALTNLPIGFKRLYKKESQLQTASLDRINNSKGYIVGNVQWVHKDVNVMKWAFSLEKFYFLCDLILENKENYIQKFNPEMRVEGYQDFFGPRVNL